MGVLEVLGNGIPAVGRPVFPGGREETHAARADLVEAHRGDQWNIWRLYRQGHQDGAALRSHRENFLPPGWPPEPEKNPRELAPPCEGLAPEGLQGELRGAGGQPGGRHCREQPFHRQGRRRTKSRIRA